MKNLFKKYDEFSKNHPVATERIIIGVFGTIASFFLGQFAWPEVGSFSFFLTSSMVTCAPDIQDFRLNLARANSAKAQKAKKAQKPK